MLRKEIKETLHYFYYPLKTEIEQCRANGTIINKEDLQKFENQVLRYATIHTEDLFKRCYNGPAKDNAMERLLYFVNSDIKNFEEILSEITETYLAGTHSLQTEANEDLFLRIDMRVLQRE